VRQFGALEAAIMDVLWSGVPDQSMSVREVLEELRQDRKLAYTTVMTVLDNLHRKGVVARERDGRAWRYTPVMSRDAYTAELMSEMLSGSRNPQSVFMHLVSQLSPEEADHLRAALQAPDDAS
jgi:predicted transcriptional regulator